MIRRLNVITVVFSDAANYTVQRMECSRRGGCVEVESLRWPTLIVVRGYGVVTKRVVDVSEKVMAEGSGFVWTQNGENVSFVRAGQLDALGEILVGARIVGIRCTDEQAEESARRYFDENLNLRTLLRPTAEGSALAQAVAARLRFPVLGVILAALMVNMVVAPRIRVRNEVAAIELQALLKTVGQTDETTRRRREMLAEYSMMPSKRVSYLCDRVASVVPEGVMLTLLAVQPPTHSLDNGRKAEFVVDRIDVAGWAQIPQQVSRYVEELTALGIARQVRLASMEQDEKGYDFKIALEL